ncbi:MAG: RNA polymerase sigma factor for flagellar operon [bacterium]|nr:MAG: RNA polymerase sigma factor for flagellar operon [bacterium]
MLKANSHNFYRSQLTLDQRNMLVENHLPQIRFIAERIAVRLPFRVEIHELINVGVLGLLDAVDKYDPCRGVQFKTYAELRVKGAILDSLREQDWAPRSLRRKGREVQSAYAQIEKKQGRHATEEEVSQALNIPLIEFQGLLNELHCLSFADLDSESDGLKRQIPNTLAKVPLFLYEQKELRQKLTDAIDRLPERERQVIALYYIEELTMKEIGLVLDITESRVSQLHTQAILKLRSVLAVYANN